MAEEKDLRIQEAEDVQSLLGHPGFKVIQQKWQAIKHGALSDLTREDLDDNTLKARQVLYNQIGEWIELPERIIQKGKDAVVDLEKDKDRKEHPIKKAVAFMGRRY